MTSTPESLYAAIDEAVLYGFPLFETARTRHRDLLGADGQPPLAPNVVRHDRALSDHETRWITTPNNDTLYSRAWLDLSAGPVQVDISRLPEGRYWSVAFMDAFTNNFAIIGQRQEGAGPVRVTLVGPRGSAGPEAGRVIRAPGNDVWLFARWLVDAEGDLSVSHQMQASMELTAPIGSSYPEVVPADRLDPACFVAVLAHQLNRNPPPLADAPVLARIAQAGVVPSSADPWPRFPAELQHAWTTRLADSMKLLRASMPSGLFVTQRWRRRGESIGDFGTDYRERAAVALGGLAALPPVEAVYASRVSDDDDAPLHGGADYCLTVPPSGVPADSFWSLTMYEPAPDGRRYFVDNPIRRYSIGDRTPGLRYEQDGSLRIWIRHGVPSDPARQANWLPAPAGPFLLSLRAYLPRPALSSWSCELPTLKRLGDRG